MSMGTVSLVRGSGQVREPSATGLSHVEPGEFYLVPAGAPGRVFPSEAGGRAIAFYPSAQRVRESDRRAAPTVELYQTGTNAMEPTMGIDPKGRVFFIGLDGEQWPLFPTQTTRTSDDGRTWENVTPQAANDHPTSEDPYLYVDKETGRIFTTDFQSPCHAVSRSDDAGATWITILTACDLLDHQTVFAGAPVSSVPIGYENLVYYCAVDLAVIGVSCLKSLDGGNTFIRFAPASPRSSHLWTGRSSARDRGMG